MERVQVLPRSWKSDSRGGLLKVLMAGQDTGIGDFGEIYLVTAAPGESRGEHYHPRTTEWFTVVRGEATLLLADPETGEKASLSLAADDPKTVCVPAGVAHVFRNVSQAGDCMILAYADRPYDPADTAPFRS
jgi:dTDP-4-dehydrorhamnose 3,5-epimerase